MLTKRRTAFVLAAVLLVAAAIAAPGLRAQSPDPSRRVPPLTLLTTTIEYSSDRYEAALLIQEALGLLGVEALPRSMDQPVITSTSRSAPWDFDGFFLSWGSQPERIDPHHFTYNMFHSSNIRDRGENRSGFNSPEYDVIAEKAATSLDPQQRRQYVFQAQEYLADQAAILPLWFNHETQAYNKERLSHAVVQKGLGLFNYNHLTQVEILQGDPVLKVAHRQDIDHLNPLTVTQNTDQQIVALIYDFLARLDANNEAQPSAAAGWRVLDDLTVEVTLKPNLTFHDGHPLTADDVKFTWEYGKQWGFGRNESYVAVVESIETPDPTTVIFKLKEPYGPFISAGFVSVPILPRHIWENLHEREGLESPTRWNNPHPIGSGPFTFGYWRRGEEIRLNRFDDYHTPARIEGLLQIVYANPDAIIGALELRQVDMISPRLSPEQVSVLEAMPHVAITQTQGVGWTYFSYNLRRLPWRDLAFRKAMAHVIDTTAITDIILQDFATPAGPGQVISPAAGFWYNPDVTRYEFDPEKAREILREAGYTWDAAGRLHYPAHFELD